MNVPWKMSLGSVAALAFLAGALPAQAYSGSATVSCDVSKISQLVTLYGGGDMSVVQNDTSPDTNRYYWAKSSQGRNLERRATSDGRSAGWSNVANSNYTLYTQVVSNTNCNGSAPGNGNTRLTYTVNP